MKTIITILIATFLTKAVANHPIVVKSPTIHKKENVFNVTEYYDKICSEYGVDVMRKCNPTVEHLMFFEACIDKYKLPKKLMFRLVQQESRFDSCAISPKGAWGYMQAMPETYKIIKKKLNLGDSATDNLEAGCYYMACMLKRYNGNQKLALAAYNSGPYNLYTKNWRIPPYPETLKYIERILN